MSGIKLSPNHGVNPAIPVCFWCGKPKNEIALLGKIDKQDSETPRHVIIDYDPCDTCQQLFSQGIHIIGVTEEPIAEGMFPIVDDGTNTFYPTGSMLVARPEWAERFLTANNKSDMIPDVLERKALLLPDSLVNELVKEAKGVEELDVSFPEENTEGEQSNEDN